LAKNLGGRYKLEELSVDRRIIIKWILTGCESVDWIHLAQDKIQWCVYIDMLTYLQGGEFLDQLSDSQVLKKDSAPCRYLFWCFIRYHDRYLHFHHGDEV
jgi:hypothetical protein